MSPVFSPTTASVKTSNFSWTDPTVPTVSGYRMTVCTTWGNKWTYLFFLNLPEPPHSTNSCNHCFLSTARKFWSWPQTFPGTSSCQWEHVLESSQRPISSACTSQLWISWRPMRRWLWVHLMFTICYHHLQPFLSSHYKYLVKWLRTSIWITTGASVCWKACRKSRVLWSEPEIKSG